MENKELKKEELSEEEKAIRRKYLASMVKYSLELKKIGICDALLQLDRDELRSNEEIKEELKSIENIINHYLAIGGANDTLKIHVPNYKVYRDNVLNKNFLDELWIRLAKGEIKLEQLAEIIKRYERKE